VNVVDFIQAATYFVLMQDSAPSRHAKATQQFLRNNILEVEQTTLLVTGCRTLQILILRIRPTAFEICHKIWCRGLRRQTTSFADLQTSKR